MVIELANLTGANLNNVKLKNAQLNYAKLSNADLSLTDECIIKRIENQLPGSSKCADSGVFLYSANE
ncbi:hypothetical protein RIVM261_071840 [Rivularia sp. IAM M-261]|nr:hypothetical protein CAL7716_019880 [Calothrix sp. PCC 7716]GJD22228.1 hypothetical protein RIVM261_071840 [Rivularia sp. IAM M-261]